ncbi:hypothetical protein [Bdellovibrio sp. HCB209]|uniref:hypothetical protein n=1 Tax=Bdellovibrio sp. HCB209 TaxID=3394354 RepID=UPI0039B5094D
MKNTISTASLTLLLTLSTSSAFAETQAAAPAPNDFKVQLKPDTAPKTAQVEHKAVHDEPAAPKKSKVAAAKSKSAAYKRDIRTVDNQTVYVVNARAPHLYMVSRDLYGNEKQWKAIADWNSIKAPFNIRQGQELVLKKEPTLSTAEADTLLVTTWTNMNRKDIADEIAGSQPAPVVKPEVPEPVPVAVAATVAAPHPELPPPAPETTAAPTEHVEEKAAEVKEEPTAEEVAKKEPVKEEPAKESHAHHSKWMFKTSIAVSKFALQGKAEDGSSDISLNSEIDYGIELEVGYHLTDKTELILGAAVEKMDIEHDEHVGEIEGHAQYIAKYTLGAEYKFNPLVTLAGLVNYEQTPFVEPMLGGAEVKTIFIPQVQLGARWNFVNREKFKMAAITDAIISLPTNHDGMDLKSGGGYLVGLKFANQFTQRTLTYGVSYRDLYQDTDESKNTLKTWFANIGMIW